ncbi:sulfotransferase family protein [Brevundimonas staleyi]|uniref:Sulfotransferase family protein n=1 Tax=Brevundimonas staleyi TaxID=74326 RepID=A0ABW0FQH2_9CAUL
MKTALVVLGMHRSGTSSVAGALTLLGAAAPRTLMAPADDNPRGFWESHVVMLLDDTLLEEAGSNWSDWRRLPRAPDPAAARDRIVETLSGEFGEADTIVLKDPRMCRLFPLWRSALEQADYRPLIVTPLRHPSEVAASLQARNPIAREQGLRLWLRHVLDAEVASRGLPRHFMRWSSFMGDWRAEVALINARLGIALAPAGDAAEIDAFLTPDLHRQKGEAPVPSLIARAWSVFGDLARHGEHPDLHADLDALRRAFDQASDLFADAP